MKKLLSKRQIQVIMMLNAVLVILFAGVLFAFSGGKSENAGAEEFKPPHNIIRAARVSTNPNISWETNIGGSGDEQVVSSFYLYNRIYIFGNTTSTDYDFAGSKGVGFAAVLTSSGNTKSFTVFPFNIVRVMPTMQGFAVAGNEGGTGLLKILNSDCVVVGSANLSTSVKHTVNDLYIYDNTYMVVSSVIESVIENTRIYVTAFKSDLSLKYERIFRRDYNMSYINIMPYKSSFILAANIISPKANYLTVAVFDAINMPAYKDFPTKFDYFAYSFIPFDDGFASLINNNGIPQVLTITVSLNLDLFKILKSDSADGAQLFFAGGSYYCFVKPKTEAAILMQLNSGLSGDNALSQGADFLNIHDYGDNEKAGFILGNTTSELKLLGISKDSSTLEKKFATNEEWGSKLVTLDDGILIVTNSNKKSSDVGGNFGGSDVWVCKVPFDIL